MIMERVLKATLSISRHAKAAPILLDSVMYDPPRPPEASDLKDHVLINHYAHIYKLLKRPTCMQIHAGLILFYTGVD